MNESSVWKTLLRLSPPVLLALLIQSIYNIVDSYFVAQYSEAGLTALSFIFPIQLLMTALATGTGTGVNILISKMDGNGENKKQYDFIKASLFLGLVNFVLFAGAGIVLLKPFYMMSSGISEVRTLGCQYGVIILSGSLGFFMESIFTKILQAKAKMLIPMLAQITGALINIALDPILIFGWKSIPQMGIMGAATATLIGQWTAMIITCIAVWKNIGINGKIKLRNCALIYQTGFPSILMQSLYTLYIVGLNLILNQFTENAVTVLGIYYKLQTFFFIPLMGLQQVIVPVVSFYHGAGKMKKTKEVLSCSVMISVLVMAAGMIIFMVIPKQLLSVFSSNPEIWEIGVTALRIISVSFLPASITMMFVVYFQGVNKGLYSTTITVFRQIVLLVPVAWILHFFGLSFVWLTFPITEIAAAAVSFVLFLKLHSK